MKADLTMLVDDFVNLCFCFVNGYQNLHLLSYRYKGILERTTLTKNETSFHCSKLIDY